METKSGELSIKQVHEGKVIATLAQLGVRDRDGDVLKNGLLKGRQTVAIKPQHKWDHVNLGVAEVYETNQGTIEAEMEFNMAIPSAKDWFEAIRFSHERHHRQQYSFGFEVTDFERGDHDGKSVRFLKHIALAEVSPVLLGASVGSQTLLVKEDHASQEPPESLQSPPPPQSHVISPHHTATDDRVWNAWLNQLRVRPTADRKDYYHALYAISDQAGAHERQQFRALHHEVGEDGEPGAANTRACLELLFWLHKGLFPAHEREGIRTHLAMHLKDAGIDGLPLGQPDHYGVPLDLRVQVSAWAVDAAVEDLMGIHEMRSRKGMTLTDARLQQVRDLSQRIEAFCQILQLKALDKPYSVQVQEFADRAHLDQLHERLEQMAEATRQQTQQAERALAEEHYQRFLAMERRFHGEVRTS